MIDSLYVHVPFCVSKCSYCDFYSRALNKNDFENKANAWLEGIKKQHLSFSYEESYKTIYFGGGSPSCLPRNVLKKSLDYFSNYCKNTEEWTIEANPLDIDDEFLQILSDSAVDRLSIGIQTFEEKARNSVCRRGNEKDVKNTIEKILSSWKGKLSCDLIYGLPFQSVKGLENDILWLLKRGIEHLSLYELTIDENTVLGRQIDSGEILLPQSEEVEEMYQCGKDTILSCGLKRYEVSNWAKPGNESKHNSVYWKMGNWIGLGPSAVSNICENDGKEPYAKRISTISDIERFIASPEDSMNVNIVNKKDYSFELLMTSLRTKLGFSLNNYKSIFKIDAQEIFGNIPKLFPEYLFEENDFWKATDFGLDMLNVVLLKAMTNSDDYFIRRQK